jgi:hypothetical protein
MVILTESPPLRATHARYGIKSKGAGVPLFFCFKRYFRFPLSAKAGMTAFILTLLLIY